MLNVYFICGFIFLIYLLCRIFFGNDDFYKYYDIPTLIVGLLVSATVWPISLVVDMYIWYKKNKI